MEVTRRLRTERVSKKGLATIELIFCWDGHRLRMSSGEKCLPQDWDDKRGRAKARPGTYLDDLNTVLNRYADAATSAAHAAVLAGRALDKAQMQAEILRRVAELAAEAAGTQALPPPPPPPEPTFAEYYDRWLGEQARRTNLRTGLRLSKAYLDSLANTLEVLSAYAATTGRPLALAGMNDAFYQRFQDYFFQERAQGLNTFGKHIRQLKKFLRWASRLDLPVGRQWQDFAAPDVATGADFLTQVELLALAGVDFYTDAARAHVRAQFEALSPLLPGERRRNGQRRSQADEYRVLERLRSLDQARDKLLQCCYLGLRISDANQLAPRHLHGEVVRLKAGKNQVQCIIPFFDDDVFRPVALVEKYRPLGLPTCLPKGYGLDDYLPTVAALAGLTRIALTSKVGRKTFATLKISQGVPRAQVMTATGHKTERSFNRYLGIDEEELVASFRKTARTAAKSGGSGPSASDHLRVA